MALRRRRRMTKRISLNFHQHFLNLAPLYQEMNREAHEASLQRAYQQEQARLAKIKEQEEVEKFKL